MQLYEEAELEVDEDQTYEETAVRLMVMDMDELLSFGDWLDALGMMYDEEMRARTTEGH